MPSTARGRSASPARPARLALLAIAVFLTSAVAAAADTGELARAGDAFVLQESGQRVWIVGNDAVSFKMGLNASGALNTMGLDRTGYDRQWKPGTAADFTFLVGSKRLTPGQGTFAFREARASATDDTVRLELVFEDSSSRIRVTRNYACTAGSGAIEVWSVFETTGTTAKVTIGDIGVWRLRCRSAP